LPRGGKKVRHKPEYLLLAAVTAFALTGLVAAALSRGGAPTVSIVPISVPVGSSGAAELVDAQMWFESVRRFCNPVEVESQLRSQPAPPMPEGAMHTAACFALAGKIVRAREAIESLPPEMRYIAAGVVFEAGHPAADAGDDIAAGPLMELVVDYWPNHYMALYHAGAARFESGSYDAARKYLGRFLDEYSGEDIWRSSATSMLDQIDRP
jgi:hypothetical protein